MIKVADKEYININAIQTEDTKIDILHHSNYKIHFDFITMERDQKNRELLKHRINKYKMIEDNLKNNYVFRNVTKLYNPQGIDDSTYPDLMDMIVKYGDRSQREMIKTLRNGRNDVQQFIVEITTIINDCNRYMYNMFVKIEGKSIYQFPIPDQKMYIIVRARGMGLLKMLKYQNQIQDKHIDYLVNKVSMLLHNNTKIDSVHVVDKNIVRVLQGLLIIFMIFHFTVPLPIFFQYCFRELSGLFFSGDIGGLNNS